MIPPGGYHVRDIQAGLIHLQGKRIVPGPAPGTTPAPVNKPAPAVNKPASVLNNRPPDLNDARRAPARALTHSSAQQSQRAKGGRDAELFVQMFHDVCEREGVAFVRKVPTPYIVERRDADDGTFVGRYSKRTRCDYEGVMLDGSRLRSGRPRRVFAECKSVADPHGPLPLRVLREHQRNALEGALASGHVAVLLVVLGPPVRRELYAVPWSVARTHQVLHLAELAPWRVKPCTAYLAHFAQRRVR